jgi:hypothetical protein
MRVLKANEPVRMFSLAIGPYGGWGTPPGATIPLGDPWGIPFTTPFFRWFNLSLSKEEIYPSEGNFFGVTGKVDTCTFIQWYPTADSVTLAVTAGSELGGFVSPESVPLGSSITRLASDIASIRFLADTAVVAGGTVTVEARSKGIVEAKTFRVLPFTGRTLRLSAGPPIIAFGRNGSFRVEALDAAGEVVPIPENITFKYEIVDGAQWGVLFDYDTWQMGPVVEGAPSVIDFLPADTAQYEDKRVVVRVSSSVGGLTPDTAEVLILPGLLKVSVTATALRYGESAEIVAEGVYRDGVLAPLDPSVLYSYEIVQVPDAGYLVVGSDTTRRDVIPDVGPTARFVAEEETPQPESVQVIIKVTAKEEVIWGRKDSIGLAPALPPALQLSVRGGEGRTQQYVEHVGVARVVVKKDVCVSITFEPHQVPPGDTSLMTLKKLKDDGTLEDFPAGEKFDLVLSGSATDNGLLLTSEGGSGTSLSGVSPPLKYIAPARIDGESLTVQVSALVSETSGASLRQIAWQTQALQLKRPDGAKDNALLMKGKPSKNEEPAVAQAMRLTLAETECPVNQVLVQKRPFPDCEGSPTIKDKIEDRTGKDDVCDKPPIRWGDSKSATSYVYWGSSQDYNPVLGICYDASRRGYRFKVEVLQYYLFYSFCPDNIRNSGAIFMTSLESLTPEQACNAKQDFDNRRRILLDRSRTDLSLNFNGQYVHVDELKAHELNHLYQDRADISTALKTVTEKYFGFTMTRDEALRQSQDQESMAKRSAILRDELEKEYNSTIAKNARAYELAAQKAQADKLTELIKRLTVKCG